MVSTFGVEKIQKEPGLPEDQDPHYEWTRFRSFARLDKKTDESLGRYFRAFVAMCRRVCHLRPARSEGEEPSVGGAGFHGWLPWCPFRDAGGVRLSVENFTGRSILCWFIPGLGKK